MTARARMLRRVDWRLAAMERAFSSPKPRESLSRCVAEDPEIAILRRWEPNYLASEIDDLRRWRQRFVALNPSAAETRIESLPAEIRIQLDEPAHWYVVHRDAWRGLETDRHTRFFVRRRDSWFDATQAPAIDFGDDCVVLRRLRLPSTPSAGVRRVTGQADRTAGDEPVPPAAVETPPRPTPVNKLADLEITMLTAAAQPQGYRLNVSGGRRGGPRIVSAGSDDGGWAEYTGLNPDDGYSLTIAPTGPNQPTARFLDTTPFERLYRAEPRLDTVEGPFHLVRHRGGRLPHLTIADAPPQFGVFFDGTGNQVHNALADPRDNDAPTNVAKLRELYLHNDLVRRHYGDGVGTQPGRSANDLEMAFGIGFGELVTKAIERLKTFARDFPQAKKVLLDVFGFSRGAAAARTFVNQVNRLTGASPDYWGGPRVRVRFVGLFDTVGSLGLPGNETNIGAELDLGPASADAVYQLTAAHERRDHFPSTSLRPASGPMPSNLAEEALPGAHADIGGGYGPMAETIHLPGFMLNWSQPEERQAELARVRERYAQHFQVPGDELLFELTPRTSFEPEHKYKALVTVIWEREVVLGLENVALARMHDRAVAQGAPLLPLKALRTKRGFDYREDATLFALVSDWESGDEAAERTLKAQYVHHSVQFAAAPGEPINSNSPVRDGYDLAPREIFYNDPASSVDPNTAAVRAKERELTQGIAP